MSITVHPDLETKLRERATAEGLSVEAYLERLVLVQETAQQELENLAVDGLASGPAFEVGADYWAEKHRQLDQRLKRTRQ